MKVFMLIIHIVSGPLIGAFIGWLTNFLAVKMLFRPHKAKYIGKIKIPFTPGVIPKRKSEIARAVGEIVETDLLSNEDLKNALTENIDIKKLSKDVTKSVSKKLKSKDLEETKCKIVENLAKNIVDELIKVKVSQTIVLKGVDYIKTSITNPMVKMFLSDELLSSISSSMAEKIDDEIKLNGESFISEFLRNKINDVESKGIIETINNLVGDSDFVESKIEDIIKEFINKNINEMFKSLKISKIVESKINDMDIKQFEILILKVMKNELNAIVWLGAILGFLIGIVNVFI